jgi:2,4-dienoyl-CoA reductase-like NADH-dependent reductase (Old Yellow Enzyme family)
MSVPKLFQPYEMRSITARNRICVAPMCQYSATDGLGDDWHIQQLGAKAMGGAGIVMAEATHVSAVGRITEHCLGAYNPAHQHLLGRLARIIAHGGAVPAIQIGHAGRKASVQRPWDGGKPVPVSAGGWEPVGPSAIAFAEGYSTPRMLSVSEVQGIVEQFAGSVRMSRIAGFKLMEIHAAHGYLLHSFLSPLSNTRNDQYGGDLKGRARVLMEIIEAARAEWPEELPMWVRLSCSDWAAGGHGIAENIEIAKMLKATGQVDLIDCSSGGVSSKQHIPSIHPGYHVPFAEAIRREAGIATGAVGMITAAEQAAEIVANERADIVLVGRALLADPAWPLHAAKKLGAPLPLPPQFLRANLSGV